VDISAIPDVTMQGQDDPHGRVSARRPVTVGQLASIIREHTGRPGQWWDLVRFDPVEPATVRLDGPAGAELWLTAWPPGHRAERRRHGATEVATLIAGELTEVEITSRGATERPLRGGRLRVFGPRALPAGGTGDGGTGEGTAGGRVCELANPGTSFAITMHVRPEG
jgi:hypothetical protein